MSSNINTNGQYGDANTRIKLDVLGIVILLCGATVSININLIGEIYMAELLLIVIGAIIVIFKGDNGVFSSSSFKMFFSFGLLTLVGYVISDIIVGTQSSQYLRGWGRVGLLVTNVVCLMLVIGQGRRYIWWFMLGMGVGGVLYLSYTGVSWHVWKLGYGERVSFIVLAIACILPRRMSVLLLVGFGILNIALDYRNFAAVYLMVACVIWARSSQKATQSKSFKQNFGVIVALVLAISILAIGLEMTKGEYGGRRDDSNVGRLAGIIVAIRAVASSPIIGYGSWTVNEEFARMLQKEQQKNLDKSRARRAPSHDVKLFRAHSQLLQPWVEGGIFGASFFLYYGYRLARGSKRYIMELPVDRFTVINLYFVILGTWHLIASPFGGEQRVLIAIAVALLAAIELDGRGRISDNDKVMNEPQKPSLASKDDTRILRRRKHYKNSR